MCTIIAESALFFLQNFRTAATNYYCPILYIKLLLNFITSPHVDSAVSTTPMVTTPMVTTPMVTTPMVTTSEEGVSDSVIISVTWLWMFHC